MCIKVIKFTDITDNKTHMKRSILSFFLIIISFSAFSQENMEVKSLINRTAVSIFKSQKEILSGHSQPNPKEFTIAVLLQAKAVEEFNSKNPTKAILFSVEARTHSNQILSDINLKGLEFYVLNVEEKKLISQNTNAISEEITSISNTTIDDKILLDPAKLSQQYKLTID